MASENDILCALTLHSLLCVVERSRLLLDFAHRISYLTASVLDERPHLGLVPRIVLHQVS